MLQATGFVGWGEGEDGESVDERWREEGGSVGERWREEGSMCLY